MSHDFSRKNGNRTVYSLKTLRQNEAGSTGGKTLIWLALLAVLGGGGFWLWKNPDEASRWIKRGEQFIGKSSETSQEQAVKGEAPSSVAHPETAEQAITKQPEGVALAPRQDAVSPQPSVVDMESLASTPSRWPKSVKLKKSVNFPIVLDGKVAGSIRLQPGTVVQLRAIKDGRLTVMHQDTLATITPNDTDLIDQVSNIQKIGN